jgi:hypothetical protein
LGESIGTYIWFTGITSRSFEDARQGFREYTGFPWTPERRWKEYGGEEYSEYYGECDVFEGDMENENGP